MDHKTFADQSSCIHLMGSPSNLASAAGACFTFQVLTMESPIDSAITTNNKDPYAMAHAIGGSSSTVSSTVRNIHLQ